MVTAAAAMSLVAGMHTYPAAAATRAQAAPQTARTAATTAQGYRTVGADGGVFDYGTNRYLGNTYTAHITPAAPIVGLAPTFDGEGYWLVGADGGVLSFGDAAFHGSAGGLRLASPVVGTAATPDGGGYWLVGADGGVFAYGDARFFGSTGNLHLAKPIVGMASTPDGGGYWLVASDGGVFAFGDAQFAGSLGGRALHAPIVGIAGPATGQGTTASGQGYLLVGADGGVFSYGALPYAGSIPGSGGAVRNAVGITATPDDQGYWIATADGTVDGFGDGSFLGDHATDVAAHVIGATLTGPWVGITSIPPAGDMTTPPVPPATPPPTLTYVANPGREIVDARRAATSARTEATPQGDYNSITAFAAGANGDATPVLTISGPDTGLSRPEAVAVNAAGNVFVSNLGGDYGEETVRAARPAVAADLPSITEYAPGASGDATPIAVISGDATGLSDPEGLALDAAGDVWVADYDGTGEEDGAVYEYAAGATGDVDVAPIVTLSGTDSGIASPNGIAIGTSGTIYVANDDGNEQGDITEYPAGATTGQVPSTTITSESFDGAGNLAVDGSGDVFVVTDNDYPANVLEFGPTAGADATPVRTIGGTGTGLRVPFGLALDSGGDLYVSDPTAETVSEFGPNQTGDVAPMNINQSTSLAGPVGLAEGPGASAT